MKERFRDMEDHKVPIDQLYQALGLSDPEKGLDSAFVEQRIAEEGENKLAEAAPTP